MASTFFPRFLRHVIGHKAADRLPSRIHGQRSLAEDLQEISFIALQSMEMARIPVADLLLVACDKSNSDRDLWFKCYQVVEQWSRNGLQYRPAVDQTPSKTHSGSVQQTDESKKDMDPILRSELGHIHVDVQGFFEQFFDKQNGLLKLSEIVLGNCRAGKNPLLIEGSGWADWPEVPEQKAVVAWLQQIWGKFLKYAPESYAPRELLDCLDKPLTGSVGKKKPDLCLLNGRTRGQSDWSQILVPGELKQAVNMDCKYETIIQLAGYVREVLTAQPSRRFALGFTICGSKMRLFEFDRVGAIASPVFDINEDPVRFVVTSLGLLTMSKQQLGYDTTILEQGKKRYIKAQNDGKPVHVVLDEGGKTFRRVSCLVGRATTCWRAHLEPSVDGKKLTPEEKRLLLVVKDSWQYPEREEEGVLLLRAAEKGVEHMAKHWFHETVKIDGDVDDVCNSIRGRLDLSGARVVFLKQRKASPPLNDSNASTSVSIQGGLRGAIVHTQSRSGSQKRKADDPEVKDQPLMKRRSSVRSGSLRPSTPILAPIPQNRVHRRVIVADYGKPLNQATSLTALLQAVQGCVKGDKCHPRLSGIMLTHTGLESLYRQAGILHRDVSLGNLMMNEDPENPSQPAFLIDLDLAIQVDRKNRCGALSRTGTRAFMAIGVLDGYQHTFMHDVESIFWVLFWICVHFDGPNGEEYVSNWFEEWNYMDDFRLAKMKQGYISDETSFQRTAALCFRSGFRTLTKCMIEMRKVIFPGGLPARGEDHGLFDRVCRVLAEAINSRDVKRADKRGTFEQGSFSSSNAEPDTPTKPTRHSARLEEKAASCKQNKFRKPKGRRT